MKEITRRDALHVAAALASAGAVGAAAGRRRSDPPAGTTGALDAVPGTADAVVYANVDRLNRDTELKKLTDTALHLHPQFGTGDSATTDALLHDIETRSDTDPRRIHRATVFGAFDGDDGRLLAGYGGAVLDAELTVEAVRDGIGNLDNVAFEEVARSGSVVYEPETEDGRWVGSLPADRVAVGTESAVYDAVDAANGEAATVDAAVERAYRNTRQDPVRFASRMPSPREDDAVPVKLDGDSRRPIDLRPLDTVSTVAGSVYAEDDVVGLEATLQASNRYAASDVAAVVTDVRDHVAAELKDDDLAALVADLAVGQRGSTVELSVERTVDQLRSIAGD